MSVLLLNSNYQFHALIDKKRAIKLLFRGKCEIVVPSHEVIENTSKTISIVVPKVLRLLHIVKSIFKNELPFNKKNVFVRDENTCQYCGEVYPKKSKFLTIDHVLPSSRGGKDSFTNCVCCCKICNEKKGNKTPEEAGMLLRKYPAIPKIMDFMAVRSKQVMEEFSWDKIMELQPK